FSLPDLLFHQITDMEITIRGISKKDNPEVEAIIKQSLTEYNMAKEGTVFTDPVLKDMYKAFDVPRADYFLAMHGEEICGGAGIAPLPGEENNICELQRMFLKRAYRGKGIGYRLMQHCIDYARQNAYRYCYLETSKNLYDAVRLYEKFGFNYLKEPMGETGHFSCELYMGLELT
ncbi:MAG: GNAT family N-acetyltransferase, partial [Luteibaculum sp.]